MAARAYPRPLLAWPARFRLATKANRAQVADFGATSGYSTVGPHHRDYASYLLSYKTVPYVRACVSVIAFSAANVKYALVARGKSDEDSTDDGITTSPLLDLLARPNPYQTGFELRELMFTDLELTGNCYVSLEAQDGRGLPTELYRLQPDRVTILGDPKTGIRGYLYTANGKTIPYGPDEVWHQKLPNPADPLYGMGTVEAMETRADSAKAMAEHEARFWQSGAKITGVLSTDGQVDQTIWDRLKENYRAFLRNSGFSTLILEQGLKYTPVTEGLASLGLLEIHHMSRDEILTMFGVPPTKVGIIESANYKAQAADQYFWQECIDPKLTRNEQAMQALVDRFHPGRDLVLRYERLNFDDDSEQANVAGAMQKTFAFTVNELRQYQGHDPLPMGDVILIAGRGAPVAIDPDTGEATILGGPTAGAVAVDERGNTPPPTTAAGKPAIHMKPGAAPAPPAAPPAAPPTPPGPALAGKSADGATARRLALVKAEAERRATAIHTPALVQAFYAQEQRVKDRLEGRHGAGD